MGSRAERYAGLVAQATSRLRAQAAHARVKHPDRWADGLAWYCVESARLQGMALALDVPAGALIAAAAVLSPGNSWSTLIQRLPFFARDVENYSPGEDAPRFPTYSANIWKALRLLRGDGVPDDEVRGRKVQPFYRALMGDPTAVVLDRHSSRHALGREVLGTVEHRAAVAGFHAVAEEYGLPARDLQAALWTVDVGAGGDVGGALAKSGGRGLG